MGVSMHQEGGVFFIAAADKSRAYAAAKEVRTTYIRDRDVAARSNLRDLLALWGWSAKEDPDGNIQELHFGSDKLGDDKLLFDAIAPFVKEGSYLEMTGDHAAHWRWVFNGSTCTQVWAEAAFTEQTPQKQQQQQQQPQQQQKYSPTEEKSAADDDDGPDDARGGEAPQSLKDLLAALTGEDPRDRYHLPVSGPLYSANGGLSMVKAGGFVKVRPCDPACGNKTYLGLYIGEVAIDVCFSMLKPEKRMSPEQSDARIDVKTNPAIWVPKLGKLVFGAESWWGPITSPEEADKLEITDSDIENTWYVKMLRERLAKEAADLQARTS